MKPGYVPICYNCTVRINPAKEIIEEYFDITPDRTPQRCDLCERWTLEGFSIKQSLAKLHSPKESMKLIK